MVEGLSLSRIEGVIPKKIHFRIKVWLFCCISSVMKKLKWLAVVFAFFNAKTEHMILMHRPHPESEIKGGALKAVKLALKQEGFL